MTLEETNEWSDLYAAEHQLPAGVVRALCNRMAGEEGISKFGTAANWAYKRKVKLSPRSTPVAEAFYAELTAVPVPVKVKKDDKE